MPTLNERQIRSWLVLVLWCAVTILAASATLASFFAQDERNQRTPHVTAQAVSKFFDRVADKKQSEVRLVWEEATRVFRAGASIEAYPDVFAGRLPAQLRQPLNLIAAQLARDGVNVERVEALTLFRGDNGLVTVDVMLVVRRTDKVIVGLYQGWSGR